MEDNKSGGGGNTSRVSSSFVAVGDRQRFTVELRPAETTIVSWRKLVKDANKLNGSALVPELPPPPPLPNAHPVLEPCIASVRLFNPVMPIELSSSLLFCILYSLLDFGNCYK